MGLFDLAGDFLKNLFTPGKSGSQELTSETRGRGTGLMETNIPPSGIPASGVQPAGIVDNATTPQAYRRMFGGQPTGPTGTPELGGGAQIITDPSQTGRYTAGGKDLGYNPINIQQPEPSEYDQKLYMQLLQQMGQPITNADYYPDINNINKGNVSVGDMSAPVYAGSFGLPPMAAIDKLKTRDYIKSAIDKMDIDRGQDQAQVAFIPPEVRQVASMPRLGGEFEKEANQYVSEMEAEFGRDWRKYAPQSPKTWSLVNRWKGIENAFNVGYDKSSEYLKLYQENQKSDNKAFFPQEGLRAAKWLQTGVNETTEGLPVDVNEIGQLMNQFEVYNNFGTWADNAIKNTNIRSTFVKQIPEAVEIKVSQDPTGSTDAEYIEAKKKYGEFPNGYRGFLIEKQTEQISGETARALVDKWDTTNPGAWQQMKKSKSESKDSVLKRLYSEFQNYLGTEIKTEIFKTAPVRNTTINFSSGSGTGDEQGVYFNMASKIPEIKDYLSTNMTANNVDEAISNAFMFGDKKGSFKPDESYVGVKIPGHFELADKETATRPFSEYVFDPSGTGVMEQFTAKGMFGGTQDLPQNLAPTSTKIKDVVITFGVPDPNSAGGYRIITKNAIRKGDKIPENAVPVMVRQDLLTFDIENYQKGLSEDEKTKNMKLLAFIGKDDKGAPRRKVTKTAYTIQPVTTELMRNYDNVVSKKIGKESSGGTTPVSMSGSVSTGSDEESLVE